VIGPSLIPAWICLPIAAAMMICLALHARATVQSSHPASRKRIRTANAWIMLINTPLLATGFSLISPSSAPRAWLLVWIAAMLLLAFSVALAVLDMLNTIRLGRRAARELAATLTGVPRTPHS
jgi:hypothetical protein